MQLTKPAPYHEAIDKLGRKSLIGSMLTSSEWRDVPVELRERAFFSSQVENVRFLQRGRDEIHDFLTNARETLPNGETALKTGSRADFVKEMQEFALAEGMGPLDPKHAGTIKDISSEKRLALIFDTQTRQAHDFGYAKQGLDPEILNEFPAQRFIRVLPVKDRRDHHAPHEDKVYLKTDPVWTRINEDFGVPWGPWGWGCGHDVEDVDRDEAEALGLIAPGERMAAPLPQFNENLKASTKGLDPDLIAKLNESFGDQIVITPETIEWAKTIKKTPFSKPISVSPSPRPTLEEALTRSGMDKPDQVTVENVNRFLSELKEENPLQVSQVIRGTQGGTATQQQVLSSEIQRFLDFVPPDLAASLHKLDMDIKTEAGENGHYTPGKGITVGENLSGASLRRTTWHEMTHWLHMNGPQDYKDAIRDHFLERTAGEKTGPLPGYGASGKRDRWWDAYAGRIYGAKHREAGFETTAGNGLEVPTRHLEVLADPDELARRWRDPDFRETMTLALRILF